MEKLKCPKYGEEENFHINYDYSQKHIPIVGVLCNECGELFNIKSIRPEPNNDVL